MSGLSYEIVDVFTDRPFTGNPLAVVFGAGPPGGRQPLSTGQMQAIAREFHLSETVFVLPPSTPDATYRARIFTPATELPFAGHPSVGVAVVQARRGLIPVGRVTQECGAGLLPIVVTETGAATLTGGAPTVGPALDPGPLLAAVGLEPADHVGPPPREAGCGLAFPYLSVVPDGVARATAPSGGGVGRVSVFAWDAATASAHTRVFAADAGVPEDPATGSAALGFGVWLVASGLLPGQGTSRYVIRQGAELGRPSRLDCTVVAEDGVAVSTTVTGHVVSIASGEIAVPPFVG